ncbi:MAG: Gfo/Idh/MocA family oxidoreductase [Acidobacteriota bacterium]|nr:Gfo/Idh/MocA family oxidoreductase [Acidobacteriota bacterium]
MNSSSNLDNSSVESVDTDVAANGVDVMEPPTIEIPEAILEISPNFTIPDPMSAPALKWGIMGTGWAASAFADQVPKFSTGNIVAVGSRSLDRAQRFAKRNSVPQAYGSYAELAADPDVEAVYIATPHPAHHDLALLALRAGKPVLVEKSFTLNAAEAEDVFMEARVSGLFAMEAMWSRFLPHQLMARELLSSGALGDIVSISAEHGQKLDGVERLEKLELGGGALLDLGVYPVSFIQSILGNPEMVDTVGLVNPEGIDEHETIAMTYVGAIATATSTMRAKTPTTAHVSCRNGRIEFRDAFYQPGRITVFQEPSDDLMPAEAFSWTWDGHIQGGFQYQAAEVARCVNAGLTQSETMPWDDTIAVMEIMDKARAQLGVRYPTE